MNISKWAFNSLIGIDQLFNALTGGDPDETISSRIGKVKRANGGTIPWSSPIKRLIDYGLEIVDDNHSIESIEDDEGSNSA